VHRVCEAMLLHVVAGLCWCALARVVWRERAWIFVDLVGFSAGLLYDFWHIVG